MCWGSHDGGYHAYRLVAYCIDGSHQTSVCRLLYFTVFMLYSSKIPFRDETRSYGFVVYVINTGKTARLYIHERYLNEYRSTSDVCVRVVMVYTIAHK